jgi:hypothetical protein
LPPPPPPTKFTVVEAWPRGGTMPSDERTAVDEEAWLTHAKIIIQYPFPCTALNVPGGAPVPADGKFR